MSAQWKYIQQGQVLGPISGAQLKAMLASGSLTWEDLVWCEGMAEWAMARRAPGLTPAPMTIELDLPAPPAASANPFSPPKAELLGIPSREAGQGGVSFEVVELLRQTKPWARLLAVLGFIGYAPGPLPAPFAPLWVLALWVLLGTTLDVSLRWLRGRWWLAALLGAVTGPLAYLGGARLGALQLLRPTEAICAQAIGFGLLLPALVALSRRCDA